MRPPSLHSNFFSSLKQVEKRLKLENSTQSFDFSPAPRPRNYLETNDTSTQSLSSPLYLPIDQQPNATLSSIPQESSEPPSAFLSSSSQSLPIHQNPSREIPHQHPITINKAKPNDVDDIELLIQLLGMLGLERNQEKGESEAEKGRVFDGCCGCEGGFYEKIVGVKGPKCKKELERLEGWIRYFLLNGNGEERKEPLRLAYLLLGKAAIELKDVDGGLESPSTIEEFLKYDPPRESN